MSPLALVPYPNGMMRSALTLPPAYHHLMACEPFLPLLERDCGAERECVGVEALY